MEKKQRKSFLDTRLFWMLVSLLLSVIIWTYVVSTESSVVTQTFRNVPIEIIGTESLRNQRNLVVTDVDANSVRIEIRGPRRIVDALNAEDLIAQVDVSKLSRAAYVSLKYKIIYPDGTETRNLSEVSFYPETVSFLVSAQNSSGVPVRGSYDGKLQSGFTAEAPVFDPVAITVSGPDAYLKDVAYAWVSFGMNQNVSSTYAEETTFTLMNSDGKPVSTEYLTVSQDTVTATLPILEVKDIPLTVELIEGAGATTANTVVRVTPDHISLAGDSAILAGLNRIILSTIDLTEFKTSFSETYPISIDNTLHNLSGVTEAKVDIEIMGLTTRSYPVKNISVIGVTETMEADILTETLEVVIRGTEEELDALSADNIRAVADLTDYIDSTGTFMPQVKVYIDGFVDVGAVGKYTVTVNLQPRQVRGPEPDFGVEPLT